jgi:hypothetical protein
MFAYIYVTSDPILLEGCLEDLVVVDVLVVILGLPVNFAHLHTTRVNGINNLTVDGPSSALLNFLNVQLSSNNLFMNFYLKECVEPVDYLVFANEERRVHDPNVISRLHPTTCHYFTYIYH